MEKDSTEYMDEEYAKLSDGFDSNDSPHDRSSLPLRLKALPNGGALVFLCFIFPAFCGFLFGYDIGTTSNVYAFMKKQGLLSAGGPLKGFLDSSSPLGSSVGSIIAYFIGDALGRRRLLMFGCVHYAVGALIQAASFGKFAPYILIVGRFVYGLGVAYAMHSAPLYIAETAPPSMRGVLVSLKELFIVGGIAAGSVVALIINETIGTQGWRVMPCIGAFIAVVAFGGMAILPATPRWLTLRAVKAKTGAKRTSFINEAREGLCMLQNKRPEEVNELLGEIWTSTSESAHAGGGWADLLSARKQLLVGIGLLVLQQVTGQPSILYSLSQIIIKSTSISEDNLTATCAVSVGITVFKMLATLICVFSVESFGRRLLLLVGTFLMLVPLMTLAIINQVDFFWDIRGTVYFNVLAITSLVVIVTAYQIGFGPVNWLIISEIFPLSVRSRAQGLSVFCNFITNWATLFLLPLMTSGLDKINVSFWWVYASMAVVSIFFIFTLVPETKGKKMEDIEALFKKRIF